MRSLTLKPSKYARIGIATFEASAGVAFLALSRPWRPAPLGQVAWLSIVIGILLLCSAIEFPYRMVVIEADFLMERLWFHWRRQALPQSVVVAYDWRGRVVIADASSRKILFRFIREFGRQKQIEAVVAQFFRNVGRLAKTA